MKREVHRLAACPAKSTEYDQPGTCRWAQAHLGGNLDCDPEQQRCAGSNETRQSQAGCLPHTCWYLWCRCERCTLSWASPAAMAATQARLSTSALCCCLSVACIAPQHTEGGSKPSSATACLELPYNRCVVPSAAMLASSLVHRLVRMLLLPMTRRWRGQ